MLYFFYRSDKKINNFSKIFLISFFLFTSKTWGSLLLSSPTAFSQTKPIPSLFKLSLEKIIQNPALVEKDILLLKERILEQKNLSWRNSHLNVCHILW